MNRLNFGLAAVVAGLVVAPNLASALSAITTESTSLRAGPAFDFPVVDRIPSEVRVNVHGCVRGYRWCDVSWRDARGWMQGDELAYLDDGRRVAILEYGPRIGLPILGYSVDTYWDRYYRGRPWYGERARWRSVWIERERGERRESGRATERREGRTDRREIEEKDRSRKESRRDIEDRDRSRKESRRDIEDRDRARAESRRELRQDSRREAERRQGDDNERRLDRRSNREERPNVRTGRGDWRERGETRGYNPPSNSGPRQEMDRGRRQSDNPDRGRAESNARGPRGGGNDRGGGGREERRGN